MQAIAFAESLYWSYGKGEDVSKKSVIEPEFVFQYPSEEVCEFSKNILLTIPVGTILPGDPIYKLNFSVEGVIECTIDGFVITAPIFDEEGYGETYESAWDDFLSSIRDRYASLVKREQGLSAPDHKVLSELRKYLSEVAQ